MAFDFQHPRLITIVGPTASGKTSLGLELAHEFNGEIISADSRQIYRGMDIGTAKASREDQRAIPHHLIDIRNPDEEYTVADFKRDAEAAIDDVVGRGKMPFLVGGTGLYVRAVVENLEIPEIRPDPELRRKIEEEITRVGLAAVFEKLVAIDPEAAYVVDPKNPRRVVRALEVATITGKPFTAQRLMGKPRYETLMIGLEIAPEELRARIDQRIDKMMDDGLLDEVRELSKKYPRANEALPSAFDAIGYREIIDHLDGKLSLDDAVAAMKLNTWHFAKRQMTWFRKDKDIRWVQKAATARALTAEFLT